MTDVQATIPQGSAVTKQCRACGHTKPVGEFYPRQGRNLITGNTCKACVCNRKKARKDHPYEVINRLYGIDFNGLGVAQGGLCGVCAMLSKGYDANSAVVDHNHKCCPGKKSCGKCVRGLIHRKCNLLIGFAEDNTELLAQAIRYLTSCKESLT